MIPVAKSSKSFTVTSVAHVRGLTPPIKYPGGKGWLVPRMRKMYEPFRDRCFVEPFCGAAACSLGLLPGRVRINDKNPYVINLFCWIRRGLDCSQILMMNDAACYNLNRLQFNNLIREGKLDTEEGALLTYYLAKTGFNGLMRFNNSGFFNVPFGRHKTLNYRENFDDYSQVMDAWEITEDSFEQVRLDRGDFVYVDPPYWGTFTNYSAGGFRWEDQVRLLDWIDRHDGPIVASNSSLPEVIELYEDAGFKIEIVEEPRRISRTGDRTPALSMLATRGL